MAAAGVSGPKPAWNAENRKEPLQQGSPGGSLQANVQQTTTTVCVGGGEGATFYFVVRAMLSTSQKTLGFQCLEWVVCGGCLPHVSECRVSRT